MQDADLFRLQADRIMLEALASGAVIHGRGGGAAFRDAPDVLRVRLFGARDARVAQGCRMGNISREAAQRDQPDFDRARAHYVKRLYGVDIDDPALYLLQIDSTVIPLDGCVEAIIAAYRSMTGPSATTS